MTDGHVIVLSVGGDSRLLALRHEVLRQAGFDVCTTCSEQQALRLIKEICYSLLLLCHTLKAGARANLIANFRKYRPQGRIIGISNVPWPGRGELDAVVYGVEGPEVLIQAMVGSRAA